MMRLNTAAFLLASLILTAAAQAGPAVEKTLCVFDPGGANGDFYYAMKDYRLKAPNSASTSL